MHYLIPPSYIFSVYLARCKISGKAHKQLKHAQRRIYKKEKGKNGRKKARNRYARKYLHISRQRTEHSLFKARHLMRSNDLVVYENLQVKNEERNPTLSRLCWVERSLYPTYNYA
jgi:transposase